MVSSWDSALQLCRFASVGHMKHALSQFQLATDIKPAFVHALTRFSTCAAKIWCAHETALLKASLCQAIALVGTWWATPTYHMRHALPQVHLATASVPCIHTCTCRFSTCAAKIWCAHVAALLKSLTLLS